MNEIVKALEVLSREAKSANFIDTVEGVLDRKRATILAGLLRAMTPMENMRAFINAGWSTVEVEFLQAALEPNEDVVRFDTWSATTTRRVIDRATLRADARPCTWSRIDRWLEQFPKIPDR